MTHPLHDLRGAIRSLVRNPRFAIAVVTTVAIGVGTTTAMFSIVDGVVLRPLPYHDAERLVYLGVAGSDGRPFFATSIPDFMDWRENLPSLEKMGAVVPTSVVVRRNGAATRLGTAMMSPDVAPMFGVAPELGRLFEAREHTSEPANVALLSWRLWQQWGADRAIVGSTISTVGDPGDGSGSLLIVGVLPPDFEIPAASRMEPPSLWLPMAVDGPAYATSRTSRSLRVMGRLAPGATLLQAQAEAESLARVLATEHPDAYMVSEEGQLTIGVEALREQTIGDTGHLVTMLLGATGFLLLIGCANTANLMLARVGDRRREIALRSALGARRKSIVAQLLTESAVLGLLGGIVGIVLAAMLIRVFHVFGPADFPRLAEVVVDIRPLTFAAVVSLTAGMLSGLAPAFISSAGSPARALRQGGRHASSGRGAGRMRRTLIVVEVALALVLLSGATLLATSYLHLQGLDPGFDADGVLTMSVGMPDAVIAADQRDRYLGELTGEISGLAGVSSVSCVSTLPVNGFTAWSPGIVREGSQEDPLDGLDGFVAGPGYFKTMGITILSGRGITSRDGADDARVAVVSATAAHRMWPGENPIGKRLRSSAPGAPWLTVVGLVADVRTVGLASEPSGEVYLPFAQAAQIPWLRWMQVVIRTTAGQPHLAGQVQDIMGRLNTEVPFDGLQPLGERVSSSIDNRRFNALIWSLFGGTAVLLAGVGLYATLLHAVGRRTREIGIRVALGASPAQMLRSIVGEGMVLSAVGMAIGLIGTFVLSRLLANLLVGVSPTDPMTLGGACLALLAVAALACAVPARRATGTDPAETLRTE